MTPFTLYTDSKPQKANITGSTTHAFTKGDLYIAYLLGAINTGTIAAIGAVSPMSTELHFLYAPHIYMGLGSIPIAIIGNSSNKFSKFSCIKIDISSFQLFPYIAAKEFLVLVPCIVYSG
jgi:hypothetical protein